MRILFLCPGLEPGRDGVGDYTRRLAAECIRQGHEASAVALHDSAVPDPREECLWDGDVSVQVLRLPTTLTWEDRWARLAEWHETARAEILSLQFVCFGFQPKGLIPWGFGRGIRRMAGNRPVHVMFHETWIGILQGATVKYRLWGAAQRLLIAKMMRDLQPRWIQTQATPYLSLLSSLGWPAKRLPLFGNIPIHPDGPDWAGVRQTLVRVTDRDWNRDAVYLVGIFGTLHPQWRAQALMDAFAPVAEGGGKHVFFILLGRHGRTAAEVAEWQTGTPPHMTWIDIGECDDEKLSRMLQTLDVGTVSTPLSMIEKSGAAAAFTEHGIPLVITRDDCHFRGAPQAVPRSSARYHFADPQLNDWLAGTSKKEPQSLLPAVAAQFLQELRAKS